MASTATILLLVYSFSVTSGYILMDDNDDIGQTLTLVSEYNIRAERLDLLSDMKTPMELWYSSEYNRSRIDVYGGMVTRYYYWSEDDGENGRVYMVYPKTDEEESIKNEFMCLKTDMASEKKSYAFPTEEDFVYAGNTEHEGKPVDMWEFKVHEEEKETHTVLYTYRTDREVDVPVQMVTKKFNTMKGTIMAHVIFNYYNYEPLFCKEDLEADKDDPCEGEVDNFHGHMKVLHPVFDGDLDIAFDSFKKHHKKDYKDVKEHDTRKEIFQKNWQFVLDHNRKNLGFKLAMNHLSDLTPTELRLMNGARSSPNPSGTISFPYSDEEVREMVTQLPEEYDLRLEGVISPIKYQGPCGSCWSFATTAAVEGSLARLDGRILDLSEQSLIDCNWSDKNKGCEGGGFVGEAMRYVTKHGLPLDEDYGGYLGQDGYCHAEDASEVFKIHGFSLVTPRSENAIKVALNKYGPVATTMQANDAFAYYSSGVFYDVTCTDNATNHAVTIVGYGDRDGVDYWVVKNSYGQQWGEDGYILISTLDNNCNILDEPYYVVV